MNLGIHAYAWTSQWSNKTLHLINKAKKLGLNLIEIPLMELELVDPIKIKERLKECNMNVITSTVLNEQTDITSNNKESRTNGVKYLKKCVDEASKMGAQIMSGVIYSAIGKKPAKRATKQDWNYSSKNLKEVAKYANDKGIIIGIEPVNRYETYLINTTEQGLELINMIDEKNVMLHLDTYHMNIEEKDFYKAFKLAEGKICHIHLCENDRGIPGTGLVDWDGIFKALSEMNYTGNACLESFVDVSKAMIPATCVWRDLAPSGDILVQEGLKFIKKMMKKYKLISS